MPQTDDADDDCESWRLAARPVDSVSSHHTIVFFPSQPPPARVLTLLPVCVCARTHNDAVPLSSPKSNPPLGKFAKNCPQKNQKPHAKTPRHNMKIKQAATKKPADAGDGQPPSASSPAFDAYDMQPTREVRKPDNQLVLDEKELEEEVTKQLTANNPNAPTNIARFSMKEKQYKFEPMVDQLVMHYASDGYLLHKAGDDAKRQLDLERMESEAGTTSIALLCSLHAACKAFKNLVLSASSFAASKNRVCTYSLPRISGQALRLSESARLCGSGGPCAGGYG